MYFIALRYNVHFVNILTFSAISRNKNQLLLMMKLCLFVGKQILHQNYWQIAAKRENFPGFENYQKVEYFYNKKRPKMYIWAQFFVPFDPGCSPYFCTLNPHHSYVTPRPSSLIPHSSSLTFRWSSLIPPHHPSTLSPFTIHPSFFMVPKRYIYVFVNKMIISV